MGKFKELRVWQEGVALAEKIYRITNQPLFAKDYGLRSQIQRAAVSISSNIAEGGRKEYQQGIGLFFQHCKRFCC